ncbi:hypothetical protein E2C01_079226 [Portunus trituberculatus]|uniref:Reverse transcriptase domain-containing protein n=1 Tax=Portunus trituberculatus TaxID=210409 RepID=A0A5B7ISR6_PORTR|nr:hypothetical protein [Portunus trituberculatus]
MFQVYVNGIQNGVANYINLFGDNAKLLRVIKTQEDCLLLEEDIHKIYEWRKNWKLEFHAKKCHVIEVRKSKRRPVWNYLMREEQIMKTKEEKDPGVVMQENLNPEKHITKIFRYTNIKVALQYLDKDILKKIIMSMIGPMLGYAAVMWSPSLKKDVRRLV